MSSVIYIREGDHTFTREQLALIHKYSDQTQVWAFLFLKKMAEQGLLSRPEWRDLREKKEQVRQKHDSIGPRTVVDRIRVGYC